jgi:hypothetical protein
MPVCPCLKLISYVLRSFWFRVTSKVERTIGRGGFGTVNAATRVAHSPAGKKGEWVAIKTLSKQAIVGSSDGVDSSKPPFSYNLCT